MSNVVLFLKFVLPAIVFLIIYKKSLANHFDKEEDHK
jgi:hypothetical protein